VSDQLEMLWNLLPHPSPDHVVRVAYRKDGKMVGDYARNLRELRRFASLATERKGNVYVAPNPTTSTVGSRHSSADVDYWSWFLIDIDPLDGAVDPRPHDTLWRALLLLGEWVGKDFALNRPVIIDSGRGAQAWIRLDDVILREECPMFAGAWAIEKSSAIAGVCTGFGTSRKTARKTMGYWLKELAERVGTMNECRVDTSCSDLPRLMRCPGTVNQKTGRLSSITSEGSGPNFGLATLLITGTPKEVFEEPEANVVPGRTWQSAFSDLTRTAQQYLLNGQEEPGRHKVCYHTAKKLAEVGCSRDEALKALLRANGLAGEDQELSPSDLKHCLDTAFRK
jgi:hypothetical protein